MTLESPGLVNRLKRLPGQLLLALVNATALLVIVACVLAILVLNRVDAASERIAGTVTDAALARLQVSPAEFKARLDTLDERVGALAQQLSDRDLQDHWDLAQQLKELNGNLSDIKRAAKGIGEAGPQITEAAFTQAGTMLTGALSALRGCSRDVARGGPES